MTAATTSFSLRSYTGALPRLQRGRYGFGMNRQDAFRLVDEALISTAPDASLLLRPVLAETFGMMEAESALAGSLDRYARSFHFARMRQA